MRTLMLLAPVATLLAYVAACDTEDPCQQYIAYMCDCHEEVDCADLKATLDDPDADVKSQCEIDLADQEAQDADDGAECPAN